MATVVTVVEVALHRATRSSDFGSHIGRGVLRVALDLRERFLGRMISLFTRIPSNNNRLRLYMRGRFIPACAGNTGVPEDQWDDIPVHPRMRGEHFVESDVADSVDGSSPHARGTLRAAHGQGGEGRFIPACAGNTIAPTCCFLDRFPTLSPLPSFFPFSLPPVILLQSDASQPVLLSRTIRCDAASLMSHRSLPTASTVPPRHDRPSARAPSAIGLRGSPTVPRTESIGISSSSPVPTGRQYPSFPHRRRRVLPRGSISASGVMCVGVTSASW